MMVVSFMSMPCNPKSPSNQFPAKVYTTRASFLTVVNKRQYSTVHLQLYTHVIFLSWHHTTFSMSRLNITRGMVHSHAWKRTLPRQEIARMVVTDVTMYRGQYRLCHV